MSSKPSKYRSAPPPGQRKESSVRRMERLDERRLGDRWPSDAEVEIIAPIPQRAMALNVSAFGLRLAVPGWLSTGTMCDLKITTQTGKVFHKRARVIWARRATDGCIAGLRVVGTRSRPTPHDDQSRR